MIHIIRQKMGCFLKETRGGVAIVAAYTLLPLILLTGLGTDLSRINMAQTALKQAVDAAAIGAARTTTSDVLTTAKKIIAANFQTGFMGTNAPQVTATLGSDNLTVTVGASTNLPSILGQLVGVSTYKITASTDVMRNFGSLEVALVLDNTGSMSGTRLSTMKSAARSFVDIVFEGATNTSPVTVSIVPFTDAVNVGPSRTSFLKNPNDRFAFPQFFLYSWEGCVVDRPAPLDQNDTPPSTTNLKFGVYDYFLLYGLTNFLDPNTYCPVSLLPLSNNKTTIKNKINQMVASGPTAVSMGLVWGWRTLSSNWVGYWPDGIGPQGAGSPNNRKVILMLTDGDNAINYYSGYGNILEGTLGTYINLAKANDEVDKRTAATCTNIKNAGIELYVISLMVSNSDTKKLMRECASRPDNYMDAQSTSDLEPFFERIAHVLRAPRVTR